MPFALKTPLKILVVSFKSLTLRANGNREGFSQNCGRISRIGKGRCKIAGEFPESGRAAAKLQEGFPNREGLLQNCGKVSRIGKGRCKIAGRFPESGKAAAKLQEGFP